MSRDSETAQLEALYRTFSVQELRSLAEAFEADGREAWAKHDVVAIAFCLERLSIIGAELRRRGEAW